MSFVAIDTGWLKVGHVDEILSFPRPKIALLASPSVRGNAVNCIYIGNFAIHSQSGPTDSEKRDSGASGPIDAEVARVMADLGITSLTAPPTRSTSRSERGRAEHRLELACVRFFTA